MNLSSRSLKIRYASFCLWNQSIHRHLILRSIQSFSLSYTIGSYVTCTLKSQYSSLLRFSIFGLKLNFFHKMLYTTDWCTVYSHPLDCTVHTDLLFVMLYARGTIKVIQLIIHTPGVIYNLAGDCKGVHGPASYPILVLYIPFALGTCEASRFDSISNQTSDSGFDS